MNLCALYHEKVAQGQIFYDQDQEILLKKLDDFSAHVTSQSQWENKIPFYGLWGRFFPSFHPSHCLGSGLYIHGDVGCGKSFLMDLFFQNLAIDGKRRVHFHDFMGQVHGFLNALKDEKYRGHPLKVFVRDVLKGVKVLCFDEFQVTDIADAMILGRLFQILFHQRLFVIITSNRQPKDLYKQGLQRQRFIPFIEMIEKKMTCFQLKSHRDYRLMESDGVMGFFFNESCPQALKGYLNKRYGQMVPTQLHVFLRPLSFEHMVQHGVAYFTFEQLCHAPLGPRDYLILAQKYRVIALNSIGPIPSHRADIAKRFVSLIDVLYDEKCAFLGSFQCELHELYPQGDYGFEFQRTLSRLSEMQTRPFWITCQER